MLFLSPVWQTSVMFWWLGAGGATHKVGVISRYDDDDNDDWYNGDDDYDDDDVVFWGLWGVRTVEVSPAVKLLQNKSKQL